MANDHAMLQSIMHLKTRHQIHGKIPKPCCVGRKFRPLDILHVDDLDPTKLKVTRWKDVIVTECGCMQKKDKYFFFVIHILHNYLVLTYDTYKFGDPPKKNISVVGITPKFFFANSFIPDSFSCFLVSMTSYFLCTVRRDRPMTCKHQWIIQYTTSNI